MKGRRPLVTWAQPSWKQTPARGPAAVRTLPTPRRRCPRRGRPRAANSGAASRRRSGLVVVGGEVSEGEKRGGP